MSHTAVSNEFSRCRLFLLLPAAALISACVSAPVAKDSGSVAGISGLSTGEQRQLIDEHNRARRAAGTPPLRWSPEIARFAQEWANHLAGSRCNIEHRPRSGQWKQRYGENLFMGTTGYYTVVTAVRDWEAEKKDYRGGPIRNDRNFADIGHYTQLVWRRTTHFGCGKSLCRDRLIVACNYDPPGNFIGRTPFE